MVLLYTTGSRTCLGITKYCTSMHGNGKRYGVHLEQAAELIIDLMAVVSSVNTRKCYFGLIAVAAASCGRRYSLVLSQFTRWRIPRQSSMLYPHLLIFISHRFARTSSVGAVAAEGGAAVDDDPCVVSRHCTYKLVCGQNGLECAP